MCTQKQIKGLNPIFVVLNQLLTLQPYIGARWLSQFSCFCGTPCPVLCDHTCCYIDYAKPLMKHAQK